MEQDKVRELLHRYYGGVTTEKEEAQLRELLSDPSHLSHFPEERHLIAMNETVPEPPDGFYDRLTEITHRERRMRPGNRVLRYAVSVAAAAVILAASWMLLNQYGAQKDTYTDPEIAMAEVKSILTDVSRKMNTGMEEMKPMRKITEAPEAVGEMSRINSIVEDNLSKLRYLNRLDNGNGNN